MGLSLEKGFPVRTAEISEGRYEKWLVEKEELLDIVGNINYTLYIQG